MPQTTKNLLALLSRIPRYSLSLLGFVAILTLCWLPASTVQEPQWFHIPNADKIVHTTLFFVWAFCLQRDASKQIKGKHNVILLVLLAGLFTAILTETLQPIVSNRMQDWKDGLADIAGTLLSLLIFPFFIKTNMS
jgi:VanZ family protein